MWSLPQEEAIWDDVEEADEDRFDRSLLALEASIWGTDSLTAGRHQLLGEPWTIHIDPLFIAAAKLGVETDEDDDREEREYCRLLAQFTTDDDLNIEIADAGVIYFVVTHDDLAACRYDNVAVWMDSQ